MTNLPPWAMAHPNGGMPPMGMRIMSPDERAELEHVRQMQTRTVAIQLAVQHLANGPYSNVDLLKIADSIAQFIEHGHVTPR